jgi:malonyl-CoA O-methyltransferase
MHNGDGSTFELDRDLLRRAFERAAAGYDQAAVVQREIGGRLLERLELIKLKPAVIVDVGCGTGLITVALLKKYRQARVIGLELSPAMVAAARKRAPWLRTLHGMVGEAEALPLANASCDLIFSNLALQWCFDLDRVFAEFRRVLKPGGALLFSTLGPDTLIELRRGWLAADRHNHVNAFLDMHDIGDALMRARLAEPVMDVERLTLTYPEVDALMRDLRALGAGNVTVGRARGLTGKGRWRAMRAAYERCRRPDGLLPVTCEVVYGHAWGPLPLQDPSRSRGNGGAAVFPLTRLRRRNQDDR